MSTPAGSSARQRDVAVAAFAACVAAATAAMATELQLLERTAQHTSILSGAGWVKELLEGNAARIRNNLGMHQHIFLRLVGTLKEKTGFDDTRWVSAEEQLAVFLFAAVTNNTNHKLAERFQRSGDMVSKCLHTAIDALIHPDFYQAYVRLPDPSVVPAHIAEDTRFFPYFKDCLGALDGSHKPATGPADLIACLRNRKGFPSINLLAASDFKMAFMYALSGWEGSACESTVFDDAHSKDFRIPSAKYYLGNAGYPSCDALLVPYRGVRYHLREWQAGNAKPMNAKELFNLRHAELRNFIERIFGVIKKGFVMMRKASNLPFDTQAKVILAMLVLHNFIRFHDPDDLAEDDKDDLPRAEELTAAMGTLLPERSTAKTRRADTRRDEIAEQMWQDYVVYRRCH